MFKVTLSDAKKTLEFLLDQHGKSYLLGVENDGKLTSLLKQWDCSEMVQYAFKLFMNIIIPDGSFNQYEFCKTYGHEIYLSAYQGRAAARPDFPLGQAT